MGANWKASMKNEKQKGQNPNRNQIEMKDSIEITLH